MHKKKQHHEEHEEHVNHEAWVIPYADMLTLLMALFLVMWATGQTDNNKLKQLSLKEVAHKQLIVEGIMAIQAGVSPRVVEELLKSHIPPSERAKTEAAPAAGSASPAAAAA